VEYFFWLLQDIAISIKKKQGLEDLVLIISKLLSGNYNSREILSYIVQTTKYITYLQVNPKRTGWSLPEITTTLSI